MTNGVSLSNLGAESSKELEKITENVVEADLIDREEGLPSSAGSCAWKSRRGEAPGR